MVLSEGTVLRGENPLHVNRRLRHATGQLAWLERVFGG
jgi:hypothetical protein